MGYQSLEKLFYKDRSSERFTENERLARQRLLDDSSFRIGFAMGAEELFLAAPRELTVLCHQVLARECEVVDATKELPSIALGALVRSLVIDEVVSTNELEGVYSTRKQISDLLESNDVPQGKEPDTRRFRELARIYLELSDTDRLIPSTPQDVRMIYDRIMHGEDLGDSAPDGSLFRRDGVEIVGQGGKVVHTGVAPEDKIISSVETMLSVANSGALPPLFGAIVSHFLFEYIHPFYDGNGRTGRYLLALFLTRSLSTLTALSLSRVIAENKAGYYRGFREAEYKLNHGELTFFVMSLMEYIGIAQSQLVDDLQVKHDRLDGASERLRELASKGAYKAPELEILFTLAQYALFAAFPEMTLDAIADCLTVGKQSARKYLKQLEAKGMVRVVTKRPLRFALSDDGIRAFGFEDA